MGESRGAGGGTLVVVAAGPGLGLAVARRFAREGWSVGLVGRTPETMEALAEDVRAGGAARVASAVADVGSEVLLRGALAELGGALGPPDVVVYNGSAYVEGSALTISVDQLRLALDVGVTGALVTAQAIAPAMRAAGRGTIVLTGSVAADRGSTSAAAVGVAKAGLRNLALALHKALAPDGVRVVTVTIDGVLSGPRALDLAEIADLYWRLHTAPDAPDAVTVFPG